jgi:hypothetical protein
MSTRPTRSTRSTRSTKAAAAAPAEAPAAKTAGRRTPEELQELLDLIGKSDSVELKLTVPDSDHRSTVAALQLDPLEAEIRQVFFLDTPDLALDKLGVVARVRRSQRKGDDSVVKLRPVDADRLPAKLRKTPDFVVEVDASPQAVVCSGSMKATLRAGRVREATAEGGKALRSCFTKEQRALLATHAPDVGFEDLAILGPIFVLKLKTTPAALGRRLAVEMWLYPDGSRILELSTRCLPSEAFQVAAEARAFLGAHGVDLDADQETKTRTALEYFARNVLEPVPA